MVLRGECGFFVLGGGGAGGREEGRVGGMVGFYHASGDECGADGEDEEREAEEGRVPDEDAELVGHEAEVGLERFGRVAGERAPACVDGVPHAHHDHARVADAHGPGERLDRDLADAAAARGVRAVEHFAVVVVVAREGVADVADLVGDVDGDLGVEHVLVLVASADGDGVPVVFFQRWFSFSDRRGGVFFSQGAAGCAWFAEERYVG